MPAFTFPVANTHLLSEQRRAAEKRLGYHPAGWFQKYVTKHGRNGKPPHAKRVEVRNGTQEYRDVEAIFLSQPASRFYYPEEHMSLHKQISPGKVKVERVENAGQEGGLDLTRGNLTEQLTGAGSEVIRGAHTRWLFHGTDNDGLEKIVQNPTTGFNCHGSWVNDGLWGKGTYFARDATYSVHGKYARAISPDKDHKMILLCLVECGLPCLGESFMGPGNVPKVHPDSPMYYTTLVDDNANPEIFAAPANSRAYPAYIIHFPRGV